MKSLYTITEKKCTRREWMTLKVVRNHYHECFPNVTMKISRGINLLQQSKIKSSSIEYLKLKDIKLWPLHSIQKAITMSWALKQNKFERAIKSQRCRNVSYIDQPIYHQSYKAQGNTAKANSLIKCNI